jgi:large subunit ribosomal protein L31
MPEVAAMKKDIHPEYRDVVFHDVSADVKFKTRSCAQAKGTIELDGEEYPCIKIDISAASHPFYTGKQKLLDTAGRVEKFQKKFGKSYVAKK